MTEEKPLKIRNDFELAYAVKLAKYLAVTDLEYNEQAFYNDVMSEIVLYESDHVANHIQFGNLSIDNKNRSLFVDGVRIDLTSGEYDCLWFMVSNPGRVITRDELYQAIIGVEWDADSRTIDVRIARIRAKIGASGEMIKAVRGKGYFFVKDPVEVLESEEEIQTASN